MEETRFAGRYVRVTTELRGDRLIERAHIRNGVSVIPRMADGRNRCIREFDVAQARVRLKLASGWLEDGEDPLACAKRELAEELGLHAATWTLFHIATYEGAVVKTQYFFVAYNPAQGEAHPEAHERIIDFADFTFPELRDAVIFGDFGSSETAYVLLRYALTHEHIHP